MSDFLGPDQAHAMLRRVSPEGRERAARERRARQQQTARVALRLILAATVVVALLISAYAVLGTLSPTVLAAAAAVFLALCAAIVIGSRARPKQVHELPAASLPALPAATAAWLEGQQALLPAPATPLIDSIAARLHDLAPQVSRLDNDQQAADAVRRLLATELPDLVCNYQNVPQRLRAQARDDGQSPDAHLLHGLQIVDEEVARMTRQLAAGDFDALASRDRFLELKYQGDNPLSASS